MARRLLPLALAATLAVLAGSRCAIAAEAAHWAPAGISSPQFESHPAFDPQTGDFYFVRSSPQFSGWRILVSHCGAQGWSTPQPPAFAGPGVEADPFFTADGKSLYFISTRATGSTQSKDLDLWRVDRNADGSWGAPVRLPEPALPQLLGYQPEGDAAMGQLLQPGHGRPLGVAVDHRRIVPALAVADHRLAIVAAGQAGQHRLHIGGHCLAEREPVGPCHSSASGFKRKPEKSLGKK